MTIKQLSSLLYQQLVINPGPDNCQVSAIGINSPKDDKIIVYLNDNGKNLDGITIEFKYIGDMKIGI